MNCLKCKQSIATPNKAHYGLHQECFIEWFNTAAEFVGLQRRHSGSDNSASLAPENTSFFQGKFKKYSAELDGVSYILKMRQDEAPELPEDEVCTQVAN